MRKLFVTILCSGIVTLSFGQEMVQVAGGTFQMGRGTSKDNTWEPVHPVTLSPYSIDEYEITYETWTKVRNWGLLHGYKDLGHRLHGCSAMVTASDFPAKENALNELSI